MHETVSSSNSGEYIFDKIADGAEIVAKVRSGISPERQLIVSAAACFVGLLLQTRPEQLPAELQPLVSVIQSLPASELGLLVATSFYLISTIDGGRRVVNEQGSFLRAWWRAYIKQPLQGVMLNWKRPDSDQ